MRRFRYTRNEIDEVYSRLDRMSLCETIRTFYLSLDGKSGKPYSSLKDSVLEKLNNQGINPDNFDISEHGPIVLEYVGRELGKY